MIFAVNVYLILGRYCENEEATGLEIVCLTWNFRTSLTSVCHCGFGVKTDMPIPAAPRV